MDQKIYRARKLATRLAISGRSFRWNTVASSLVGCERRGYPGGCGGILFPEERREHSSRANSKKEKKCIQFFPLFENFAFLSFGRRIKASNLWRPIEELRNSQGREGDEHERLRIDDRRMDLRLRHATCRVIEQVLRQTRIASLSRDDRDDSVIFLARWLYRYRYNSMQWYRRDDGWKWSDLLLERCCSFNIRIFWRDLIIFTDGFNQFFNFLENFLWEAREVASR